MDNNTQIDLAAKAQHENGLNPDMLPSHVAVIMDGNGRWGLGHGGTREYGHLESVDAMRNVVTAADDLGIAYLSLFCFSTENIARPPHEVDSLFRLFNQVLDTETVELHKRNVKILTSGFVDYLPSPLPEKFNHARELTADNSGLTLNLCVMYSGRSEIVEAAKALAREVAAGRIEADSIDESSFGARLYNPGLPDVDLTIRTSGEMRVSNFLLWQMAYSEMVFSDVLWTDYSRKDFIEALAEFLHRNRRFGKV